MPERWGQPPVWIGAQFMGAGLGAVHYLGHAFWLNERDRAAYDTGRALADEQAGRPESHEPDVGA